MIVSRPDTKDNKHLTNPQSDAFLRSDNKCHIKCKGHSENWLYRVLGPPPPHPLWPSFCSLRNDDVCTDFLLRTMGARGPGVGFPFRRGEVGMAKVTVADEVGNDDDREGDKDGTCDEVERDSEEG